MVGLRKLERKVASCEGSVAASCRRLSNTRSVSEFN